MGSLVAILDLLPVLAIILFLGGALGLIAFWYYRPNFGYTWLVASLTALVAWLLILFSHPKEPLKMVQLTWEPGNLAQAVLTLELDQVSWSFSLALASLVLAVILTEIARAYESDWSAWAGSLFLAGLGLLGVMAGNLFTMILVWTAIDIAELLVFLWHIHDSQEREVVLVSFSTRLAGTFLLIYARYRAGQQGMFFTFDTVTPDVSILLIIAAGLRLSVIPLHLPLLQETSLRRGMGTMFRLVPAASSLALLARGASSGFSAELSNLWLAFTGITSLIAAFAWATAKDELQGRPYWIVAISSFSLAAALRGQPSASLAWGITLILSGGVQFLASARQRNLLPIAAAGLWCMSLLPFSAGWDGSGLYRSPFNAWLIIFLLAHAILMTGYFIHAIRQGETLQDVERWVQLIYPAALIMLPVVHQYIGVIHWLNQSGELLTLERIWPGMLGLAISFGLWQVNQRIPRLGGVSRSWLRSVLSLRWMYKILWRIYRSIGYLMEFLASIVEGEGGVLWAFLLLALILAYLAQGRIQ